MFFESIAELTYFLACVEYPLVHGRDWTIYPRPSERKSKYAPLGRHG